MHDRNEREKNCSKLCSCSEFYFPFKRYIFAATIKDMKRKCPKRKKASKKSLKKYLNDVGWETCFLFLLLMLFNRRLRIKYTHATRNARRAEWKRTKPHVFRLSKRIWWSLLESPTTVTDCKALTPPEDGMWTETGKGWKLETTVLQVSQGWLLWKFPTLCWLFS